MIEEAPVPPKEPAAKVPAEDGASKAAPTPEADVDENEKTPNDSSPEENPEEDGAGDTSTPETIDFEAAKRRLRVRDDLLQVMRDRDVDIKKIEQFQQETRSPNLSAEKMYEMATSAFPQLEELLTKFKEIDTIEDLAEDDIKKLKAEAASVALSEYADEDELAGLALKLLAAGGGELAKWFAEGIQSSDLTRLIDAVIMGADYNSAGAISQRYKEAKEKGKALEEKEFFDKFKDDPHNQLDKLDELHSKRLSKELNFSSDILQKAKTGTKEEKQTALKDYFLELSRHIETSAAPDLLWDKASAAIGNEIFEDKVLGPEIRKKLEELSKGGDQMEKEASRLFGIQN